MTDLPDPPEVPDARPADETPPALFSLPRVKQLPLFDVPQLLSTTVNMCRDGRVIE